MYSIFINDLMSCVHVKNGPFPKCNLGSMPDIISYIHEHIGGHFFLTLPSKIPAHWLYINNYFQVYTNFRNIINNRHFVKYNLK